MSKEILTGIPRIAQRIFLDCIRRLYPPQSEKAAWRKLDNILTAQGDKFVGQEAWNMQVCQARPARITADYMLLLDSREIEPEDVKQPHPN